MADKVLNTRFLGNLVNYFCLSHICNYFIYFLQKYRVQKY